MKSQMIVRIDPDIKNKFYKIARIEGTTPSEKVREMVKEYVAKADISAVVDDLWDRISEKAQKRGITEAHIDNAIKEARASRKKR